MKEWLEYEQTEGAKKSGDTITPHSTNERKRAVRSSQKATGGKMLDYNEESEDSFDELDGIVGNNNKTGHL